MLRADSDGSDWKPVAFFSRKLRPAEQNYSAFDRELLAAYLAIRHFRYFLEGRPFTLFTDHKPLTFAISKISDPWSPRQQRHLAYVSEFTTDVRHNEGKANTVADTLSRGEISAISSPQPGVDYKAMAAAQRTDASITAVPTATTGLVIRDIPLDHYGNSISCDISTGRPRPLVPDTWQRTVFDAVHDLSHPSIRATKQLVAAKFVWPGLRKQVGIWAKACLRCQAAKVHRHTTAPVDQFVPATRRFDHIHVDIVGPLPPSQNYRYLLTVVDRFTRWPEAIPLVDAQTTTCAKALALHWIARFGVPAELTSDRGSQFTSELWATLSQLNGTRLHRTTAYHPQSNGIVERFHRHLKSALMARLTGPDWIDELPWVLLGIRTVPKEDLECSSAEMVYGAPLTVPGDFLPRGQDTDDVAQFLPRLRETVRKLAPRPPVPHGTRPSSVPTALADSRFVFVRRDSHCPPLTPPYEGPYKVLVHGDKSFVLDYGNRRPDDADRGCQTSPSRSSTYRRGDEIWPPRQTPGTLYSPLTGAGGGSVADWPTGQSLFLISHPDVKLVNILLSTTRVSLVQNKFVFCQLRVHYKCVIFIIFYATGLLRSWKYPYFGILQIVSMATNYFVLFKIHIK